MSVTCGFFNAVNHDRTYDAKQMSSIFDGIINDGVFMNIGSGMAIKANPGEEDLKNMNVYVQPGRCWFNSTWTLNDAILPIQMPEAEMVLDRIDMVVLEVNHNDSVRKCEFKIIKGTPATEPVSAELEDSEYVHQHVFARVHVKAGVTEIKQENITNCIGTSETPYVTGILETIDADDLLDQWTDQYANWFAALNTKIERFLKLYVRELKAGNTTITLTDPLITGDSLFSFYTSNLQVTPMDAVVDADEHSITVTFEAQSSDVMVGVSIDG